MKNFTIYKVFGFLSFLFGLGIVFTAVIGRYRLALDTQSIIRLLVIIFVTTVIGIGLMYRRKWAAIVFSLATLSAGLWLIIGSLFYVSFPYMLINFLAAVPLLLPTLITISFREQLYIKGEDLP